MAGPVKEYRIGGIRASVWQNEFEGKQVSKVAVTKSYKDKEGVWKETNQFTMSECLVLAKLVEKAYNEFAFVEKE